MADRNLSFSAPMVRALLAGRKTQTRRVIRKPAAMNALAVFGPSFLLLRGNVDLVGYAPGDRLWVREAWRTGLAYDDLAPSEMGGEEQVLYEADGSTERWYRGSSGPGRYRHARFMPRWASRLTLQVADVRVERLQDISEADAIAEGVYRSEPTAADEEWNREWCEEHGYPYEPLRGVWMAPGVRQGWGRDKAERDRDQWGGNPQFCYKLIWNNLHGADAWDANPWVVAISFTVHRGNIDQMWPRDA